MDTFNSTTVLLVRRDGKVCMASDGQVTMNQSTIVKGGARKVRRVGKGKVLVGFAGGGADALALFGRLEEKLEEFNGNLERAVVELAKDWRTDRALRQLQAMIIVTDKEKSFFVSGVGELMQPDEEEPRARRSARAPTTRSPPRAPCCGTPRWARRRSCARR